MLEVLCSEIELGEYGEVLAVGDLVRRLGTRRRGDWFGTGLDGIEHWFDRSIAVVGAGEPLAIAGEVVAIASVYTRFTERADGVWGPLVGSAWIEPVPSTAVTRRPLRRIRWRADPRPGSSGHFGQLELREGDEALWGWRVTLHDVTVEPSSRGATPRRGGSRAGLSVVPSEEYSCDMDLLMLALGGGAMVVVVFTVGVLIEIGLAHRFGLPRTRRQDPEAQLHQQAVRGQLGGFGPNGGPQH